MGSKHRHPSLIGNRPRDTRRLPPVSSDTFSHQSLRESAAENAIVREYRGTTRLAHDWPGRVVALVRGARVIR